MKKQMIVIAFLSAVVCLTGCGADINVTTAQPAAAPVSAVSAGAAQTSAPAADASATTTADAAKTAGVQADIQNIIGIWNEADVLDSRTLTVNADGTYELAYRGGGKQYGTVTVSTGQHPDGSPDDWYNFYETDGTFWTGFPKSDKPLNEIYSGQDGAMHFVRAGVPETTANPSAVATQTTTVTTAAPQQEREIPEYMSLSNLTGEWYYQVWNGTAPENKARVTVETDGTYYYQPLDGSAETKGIARAEFAENSDGSVYAFHETTDLNSRIRFTFTFGQYSPDVFYEKSDATLVHMDANDTFKLDYIGQWSAETQWNGNNYSIQISQEGDLLKAVVSGHSAAADYQWIYSCKCCEDNTCLLSQGGGTLNRTDYAPDGEAQETVTVYNDGEARFSMKGGVLFWEDCKDATARQVGFRKNR